MTNEEKYKTLEERESAYLNFCKPLRCDECNIGTHVIPRAFQCVFRWLALEAEEKPLPCPFCGGEAEVSEGYSGMPKGTFVQCKNCWAFVAGFKTKTDAIAAWNRRVK